MTISSICRKTAKMLFVAGFWILVWQICAMSIRLELLLPSPKTVLLRFFALLPTAQFHQILLRSLARILLGIVSGSFAGILLGVITWRFSFADLILSPALRFSRAVPVVSFILFLLLWTKRDGVPTIITALMVMPILWQATANGISHTDKQLVEMARVYRFTPIQMAKLIYLPSILPFLFPSLISAVGLGFKSAVAAEVLCLPALGAGTQIAHAKLYLETADLFVWTIGIVFCSLILESCTKGLFSYIKGRWHL